MIADRYSAAPEISYFETPVVVENTPATSSSTRRSDGDGLAQAMVRAISTHGRGLQLVPCKASHHTGMRAARHHHRVTRRTSPGRKSIAAFCSGDERSFAST
jgi:hypothetical protein